MDMKREFCYVNLRNAPFFGEFLMSEQTIEYNDSLAVAQGCRHLIRYLVNDLIFQSHKNIKGHQRMHQYQNFKSDCIFLWNRQKVVELKKYTLKTYIEVRDKFYEVPSGEVVNTLFEYYFDNLDGIPLHLWIINII